MSTKASFTPEEWQLVFTAPPMAGLGISSASPNGPFGVMKEMFSVGMAIGEIVHQGSSNELVKSLVEDIKQRGTKPTPPAGVSTPEAAQTAAVEHMKKLSALLAQKSTPAEASEFKRWVLGIANRVAEASSEGGFLGFGGEKVSAAEKAMLQKLSDALGVTVA